MIDNYLDRTPGRAYNCLDFVREVWLGMTGRDVTERLTGLVGAFSQRKPNLSGVKEFRRLNVPEDPCFVVMQRFRCVPHVGIWMKGRVLHLTNRGVQFQPLQVAQAYFTSIRFYNEK